ncbi:MAG: hydrogenase formation protein HypD [Bacteriovoracaceae bacterium]
MKYLDEFRDPSFAKTLSEKIHSKTTQPWTIMEICGGQTHAIVKSGLENLLPSSLSIVHGPGCPVCVTPLEMIEKAILLAQKPDVIFTSFGDMLRVPGSTSDLLTVKANGGDVRIVYSPLDAVVIAEKNPDKEVIFFAVGFETTAPANAMAVWQAYKKNIKNFSILCSHVLVPPAMEALLSSSSNRVQGFLAAGHVCTVMGYEEYIPLAKKYRVPIVVTGFEPIDILHGTLMLITQLEEGRYELENQYSRMVKKEGNVTAQEMIFTVFEISRRTWRGIGEIPKSGYTLKKEFARYDVENKFDLGTVIVLESPLCIAGNILRGLNKPFECSAFGKQCTPEHPLGAPMVSSEGACAAYYNYKRQDVSTI